MNRKWRMLGAALLAVIGLSVWGLMRINGGEKPPGEKPAEGKTAEDKADTPEAAVRKTANDFVKAFNAGDAKAVAALWTLNGEMVLPDGSRLRGRKAIEERYAAYFKEVPKVKSEVSITSIRLLGRNTATEDGKLTVIVPGESEPSISIYTALHVKDEDGWKMASVREYVPSAGDLVSLKDIEWLVGTWTVKTDKVDAKWSFAWDEAKVFLVAKYSVKRDGKLVSSGTQMIGKGADGELRSWQFESTGATGEWAWWRDGRSWVIDTSSLLPNGDELVGRHILVPLGKDAFQWQTVERAMNGIALPDLPPLKVERVKADK